MRAWRTLKSLGVVYIQQSVCVAPDTQEVRKKLQSIHKLITSNQGEALLLEVQKFATSTENHLFELFDTQRITEYDEFLEGCRHFIEEIDSETNKNNFSYHEIEENEAELGKLKRWVKKIGKRDFFGCSKSTEAAQRLNECERNFNEFMEKVYATEGKSEGSIQS